MCGRFADPNLSGGELDLSGLNVAPVARRFNVKPTQEVLILGGDPLRGHMARWSLIPSWHKGALADWKATTFNARIEDAARKPAFRQVWKHGRCLIPAGGFFEWTGPKGARQPVFFSSATNEETLYFAGLASRWEGLLTCTILTRGATGAMAGLHDRMPVILDTDERAAWLDGSAETEGLGAGARLRHWPVAKFGTHDDGPALIEPDDRQAPDQALQDAATE